MLVELLGGMAKVWPLTLVGLVVAGRLARALPRRRWRYPAYLALVLFAPILLSVQALFTGCLPPGADGERCYWYGFGLVVATIYAVPASALAVLLGAVMPRRFRDA